MLKKNSKNCITQKSKKKYIDFAKKIKQSNKAEKNDRETKNLKI